MNVKELKERLKMYPDDMEIFLPAKSDWLQYKPPIDFAASATYVRIKKYSNTHLVRFEGDDDFDDYDSDGVLIW